MKEKIRVLLVEDEAFTAMSMRLELQSQGYDVVQVTATGEEAVANFQKYMPDIALLDINLAGPLDGVETAKKIRSFSNIPFIFITGYNDVEYIKQIEKLPPFRCLYKPIRLQELEETLDSVITELQI